MAGNASDARRAAERAYNDAKRAGVSGKDLASLKGAFDAARTTELNQTGQNEQMGYGTRKR